MNDDLTIAKSVSLFHIHITTLLIPLSKKKEKEKDNKICDIPTWYVLKYLYILIIASIFILIQLKKFNYLFVNFIEFI